MTCPPSLLVDVTKMKENRKKWSEIEGKMLTALQQSAEQSRVLPDEAKSKWIISTTHKETNYFLNKMKVSRCSGLMYDRTINDFRSLTKPCEDMGKIVWRYIDLNEADEVDDLNRKLLQKQKEEMKSNVPYSKFQVNWDKSGVQIETHPDYLKDLADKVRKDLMSQIQDAVKSEITIDEYTSDIAQHVALCHKREEGFIGRTKLLQEGLKYFYENPNGAKEMLVIHAVSGAGKTSFMSALALKAKEVLKAKGKQPLLISRFCGISPFSSSACDLLQSINYQIVKTTKANDGVEDMKDMQSSLKSEQSRFIQCLSYATADKPIVIFIDSLDQLSDKDLARANITWLPNDLPQHVYLVVSTLPDIGGCFNSLKTKCIPEQNFIEILPLDISEAKAILHSWLESAGRTLQPEQFNHLLNLAIQEVDGERPTVLRLKLLFDLSKKWASYDMVPELVPSVHRLLENFFEKLEKIHGKVFVQRVFGLINNTRRGLSEEELMDIVSTDDEVLDAVLQFHQPPIRRLPQVVFARFRNAIGEYMVERGANNKTTLAWYHRQFWEACKRRYNQNDKPDPDFTTMDQSVKGIPNPLLIAKYFSGEAHEEFLDRGLTQQPIYWSSGDDNNSCKFNRAKLSELPHSLYLLEKYGWDYSEMTQKYLCDLQFMVAKITDGFGRELLEDFSNIVIFMESKVNEKLEELGKKGRPSELVNSFVEYRDRHFAIELFFIFLNSNIHILNETNFLQQVMNTPIDGIVYNSGLDKSYFDIVPWKNHSKPPPQYIYCTNKLKAYHELEIMRPPVSTLDGHSDAITDVKFVKGSHIISSSADGWVIIWSTARREPALKISIGTPIEAIGVIKTDKEDFQVVAADRNGWLHLTEVNINPSGGISSNRLSSWHAHSEPFNSIYIAVPSNLLDGKTKKIHETLIASGVCKRNEDSTYFGELKIWKYMKAIEAMQPVHHIVNMKSLHKQSPADGTFGMWNLEFSPDSNYLIVVLHGDSTFQPMKNNILSIIDVKSSQAIWSWPFQSSKPPKLYIHQYNMSTDGWQDVEYFVNKLEERKQHWEIFIPCDYRISRLCITISDRRKLSALHFWDMEVPSVDYLAAPGCLWGDNMIIAAKDEVRIWDTCYTYEPPEPFFWTSKNENTPYVDEELEVKKRSALKGSGTRVTALANRISSFTGKETTFCVGFIDGTIKLWSWKTGLSHVTTKRTEDCHEGRIFSLALSPDRKHILTGSSMGVLNEPSDIKKWDAQTGELIGSSEPLKESLVSALAFTPDGKHVVMQGASTPNVVKIIESGQLTEIDLSQEHLNIGVDFDNVEKQKTQVALYDENNPVLHSAAINPLDVSSDGKWICTTLGVPKMISLIDIDNKKVLHIEAHDKYVLGARFSPDGKYVATWSSALKYPLDPDDQMMDGTSEVKLFHMTPTGRLERAAMYELDKKEMHFVKGDHNFPGMFCFYIHQTLKIFPCCVCLM